MIHLVEPVSGTKLPQGVPFTVQAEQQEQEPYGGVATCQFSNDPMGPWTTCQTFAGGGPLAAEPVPVSSQDANFAILAKLTQPVHARIAVFADQSLSGVPIRVSEGCVAWGLKAQGTLDDPPRVTAPVAEVPAEQSEPQSE